MRPVLRLTPARKAERRTASKAIWVRRPSWRFNQIPPGVSVCGRSLITTMVCMSAYRFGVVVVLLHAGAFGCGVWLRV